VSIVTPGDEDQPATKRELREVESRLLDAMNQQEKRITVTVATEMARQADVIATEMARQANTIIEQIGAKIGVVDEKYQDLPGRVARVEQRLEEHASDDTRHDRPRAPRRARTPKRKR
jgi:hypothetical protein